MIIQDFDRFSIGKAKRIYETLDEITPYLRDLKKEYEEEDKTDDGEDRKLNSGGVPQKMRIEGADSWPSIVDVNLTLGFLAYNDAIEIEEEYINERSSNSHTNFFPSSYDHQRAGNLLSYLECKIDEEKEVGGPGSDSRKVNLDDFDPDKAYEEVR